MTMSFVYFPVTKSTRHYRGHAPYTYYVVSSMTANELITIFIVINLYQN